jgi:hypothetical protein
MFGFGRSPVASSVAGGLTMSLADWQKNGWHRTPDKRARDRRRVSQIAANAN